MAANSSSPLRCPYPNCGDPGGSLEHLSGGVYCCARCSRLSMMCSEPSALSADGSAPCAALNRPFSRFCRRCGSPLWSRRRGRTIAERWRLASRFDDAYRLSAQSPADEPALAFGPPVNVIQLQDLDGARPPQVLLEWRFVDGVLAIHQGGGFMAVVNPFAGDDQGSSLGRPIWTQPEERHVELRDAAYEAQVFRPYPPAVTGDRRYLLFSTPYAAFALDLCSLPGWTAGSRGADFRTLVDCTSQPDFRLAAAPVPLSQDPHQVGLLLYGQTRGEYFWRVLDLARGPARPSPLNSETLVPLKMRGWPCQSVTVEGRVIALSTDRGHWVWRLSDAAAGKADAMVRTWPAGESTGTLFLDYHVGDRKRFWRARQRVCWENPLGGRDGFEWYYQVSPDGIRGGQLEYYFVPLSTLEAKLPTRAETHREATPIGPWRSPDSGNMMEMLFLDGGTLYRSAGGVAQLGFLGLLMDPDEILSLWLDDPLLVVLSVDKVRSGCQQITVFSLRDQQQRIHEGGMRLAADPLVWSRWLFTCRREGARLAVCRTEIPIAETRSEEA